MFRNRTLVPALEEAVAKILMTIYRVDWTFLRMRVTYTLFSFCGISRWNLLVAYDKEVRNLLDGNLKKMEVYLRVGDFCG